MTTKHPTHSMQDAITSNTNANEKLMSLPTHNNDDHEKTIYVLITAHPDDEAMFFVPTLYWIMFNNNRNHNTNVHLICLSHGNYDGLGKIRAQELHSACNLLGFSQEHERVHVLDILQDHPREPWPCEQVATCIETQLVDIITNNDTNKNGDDSSSSLLQTKTRIVLLTFDYGGVSGHVNHRDTFLGVKYLLSKYNSSKEKNHTLLKSKNNIQFEGWQLDTIRNPIWKYFPFLDLVLIMWQGMIQYFLTRTIMFRKETKEKTKTPLPFLSTSTTTIKNKKKDIDNDIKNNNNGVDNCVSVTRTFRIFQPWKVWNAMAAHQSQFVWYRRLSVLFSRYTYFNSWRRISCIPNENDDWRPHNTNINENENENKKII